MSNNLKTILAQLAIGETLSEAQAEAAFGIIMSGEATPAQIAGLLMAMRVRGETVPELAGAVRAIRARMLAIEAPPGAIDVCGTGGDNIAKEDVVAGWVGSPTIDWMLKNVTSAPNSNYSYWVSENVFAMFQLMFAIITPALILGSIAERMKFKAILVFMTLWMLIVYFTPGHAVWGINGYMNGVWNAKAGIHAIDFAGGTVVHMTSGYSALILCLILGKRKGFGKENFAPHSLVLTYIGTGMLWVGWYGFNSGSACAAAASTAWSTVCVAFTSNVPRTPQIVPAVSP